MKKLPDTTGASVIAPQLMAIPDVPKASATRAGKTPKSAPYARPVSPESQKRRFGSSSVNATIWARVKMQDEATNVPEAAGIVMNEPVAANS